MSDLVNPIIPVKRIKRVTDPKPKTENQRDKPSLGAQKNSQRENCMSQSPRTRNQQGN
jgi:hypothetical protein